MFAGRRFSAGGEDPLNAAGEWGTRDVRIETASGEVVFEQRGVRVPAGWSATAANIVAQKYFRGAVGSPGREWDVGGLIKRVVSAIAGWGWEDGYFRTGEERDLFSDELTALLVGQRAAFNSPVWFNLGVEGAPDQVSACFILSVDDDLESILDWTRVEGLIFRGGSGSGVNLSRLRGSMELLSGGGVASGPVSFMAGADASAGAIKSGGKTRRAAKMVCLDVDHPDVYDFVWCKAVEERKARALAEAGFGTGLDDVTVRFQNANNSVRVSDGFMRAVKADAGWELTARTTGETVRRVRARDLWRRIAEAAWECADPGVQFSTTINEWHTCSNTGPINASNPCSEYVHLDNSACNLSSLNLLKFLNEGGEFDAEGFAAAVRVMTVAMDIMVDRADYPTARIGENTRRFRQLGIGFTNLGAALMALGVGYDSPQGRRWAALAASLMTAAAYAASGDIAARLGPFAGFETNREPMTAVIRKHREAAWEAAHDTEKNPWTDLMAELWNRALERCEEGAGLRNAQATVLAPTGTISFLMDCDTTGIEPDLGLVKYKQLVGGGRLKIVNRTIGRALRRLGYLEDDVGRIVKWVEERDSIDGAPGLDPAHRDVFATSLGDNPISVEGHLQMMAAVQPFLSGAISKTVNLPEEATVEDVEETFMTGWRLGLKAVAVYRDGCKVVQPLSDKDSDSPVPAGEKRELPPERKGKTVQWQVGDCKGYMTTGEYEDGSLGEIFVKVSKHGGTLSGLMDSWAIAISNGLQRGVPLEAYLKDYLGSAFPPAGVTTDPDVRIATSLPDFLIRKLAVMYLPAEKRREWGLLTPAERAEALPGLDVAAGPEAGSDSPFCMMCGTIMARAGSCYACPVCGTTSGCS